MTLIDLKIPQKIEPVKHYSNADSLVDHTTNKKSKLKGWSVHEIVETNDQHLDEVLHNVNL